ncbi:MAG: TRAP transporter substrate-binding protein DctP [Pseudomonadota bacterium]
MVVLVAALNTTPAVAATKLRITTQLPPSNPIAMNLYRFKGLVEQASGGEIEVEVFDSAQLYKDKEVAKAVASGAIDMGSVSLTRFSGTTPAVELFASPFVFQDFDAVVTATEPGHVIRDTIESEVSKTGARILWWQPFGMAVMLSKDEPIDTPAKMKGKKVRAFGKGPGAFVKALGGAPTVMSGSEQFLAYQRGTVDAGMTGVTAVKSRKLYEVMDYMIRTNHAVAEFVVIINENVWQSLDEGQRKIITQAAQQVEREMVESYARTEAEVIGWIKQNTDMEVVELSEAERKAFREASASVIQDFIEEAGPTGRALVEEARKLN